MINEKRRVFGLLYDLYSFLYIWVEQNLQFSIVLCKSTQEKSAPLDSNNYTTLATLLYSSVLNSTLFYDGLLEVLLLYSTHLNSTLLDRLFYFMLKPELSASLLYSPLMYCTILYFYYTVL